MELLVEPIEGPRIGRQLREDLALNPSDKAIVLIEPIEAHSASYEKGSDDHSKRDLSSAVFEEEDWNKPAERNRKTCDR